MRTDWGNAKTERQSVPAMDGRQGRGGAESMTNDDLQSLALRVQRLAQFHGDLTLAEGRMLREAAAGIREMIEDRDRLAGVICEQAALIDRIGGPQHRRKGER